MYPPIKSFPKMCYGKGVGANLGLVARYGWKNGQSWKYNGASLKKFDTGIALIQNTLVFLHLKLYMILQNTLNYLHDFRKLIQNCSRTEIYLCP